MENPNSKEIKCPKCGFNMPITDVLQQRLNEQVNEQVLKRFEKEKLALEETYKQKYLEENSAELKTLKEKLIFEEEKRKQSQAKEIELIKKQNELEYLMKNQDLEIARKLQTESKIIEEKVRKEEQEKQNFTELELRKQLDDTKKMLSEAQRKAQQGSMQTQGEVLELSFEENLRKKFIYDEISPVPKGINGADIIHKVVAANNESAGIIAWELKQTKAWTEDWVNKLKDDGHLVNANLLVLVTTVLPKEIDRFGPYKGIWVTNYESAISMATALRSNLLSVYSIALSNENSQDKAIILYKHLTSQSFINRVKSVSETHSAMMTALERERNAMANLWKGRQEQIERLSSNTRQIFSEIGAIAGGQFAGVEMLEELATDILPESKSHKNEKSKSDQQANLFGGI